MQKKKVLEAELPEPEEQNHPCMVAARKKIGHEIYVIADLYRHRERHLRVAVTKDDYSVYSFQTGKWSNANADNLCWCGIHERRYHNGDIAWSALSCDKHSKRAIQMFDHQTNQKPGLILKNKMNDISYEKRAIRENTERKKKEEELNQTPDVPQEFYDFGIRMFEDTPNILFYKRKGNKAHIQCGKCGASYEIRTSPQSGCVIPIYDIVPRDGEHTICKRCRCDGIYRPAGRVRWEHITNTAWILQNVGSEKIVVREFEFKRTQQQGVRESYQFPEVHREYLGRKRTKKYYGYVYCGEQKFSPYSTSHQWSAKDFQTSAVYGNTIEVLHRSEYFKYCDVEAYSNARSMTRCQQQATVWKSSMNLLNILRTYARLPQIEFLLRMGYQNIVRNCIDVEGNVRNLNTRGKTADDILRIQKDRVKELAKCNVTSDKLKIYQFEKEYGRRLRENEVKELCKYQHLMEYVKEIVHYVTIEKGIHYIEKQCMTSDFENKSVVCTYYRDYLNMRSELGYDMTNTVFLFPKSLKAAHDAMVEEKNRRANEEHIQSRMEMFPEIEHKFKRLAARYCYEKDGYFIRPAMNAGEIIMEGRLLHHCVGGDNYLKKHNNGDSAILFLRRKETPDVPYITIEINQEKVLQWHGEHNRKPDEEYMDSFIREWFDSRKRKRTKVAC